MAAHYTLLLIGHSKVKPEDSAQYLLVNLTGPSHGQVKQKIAEREFKSRGDVGKRELPKFRRYSITVSRSYRNIQSCPNYPNTILCQVANWNANQDSCPSVRI